MNSNTEVMDQVVHQLEQWVHKLEPWMHQAKQWIHQLEQWIHQQPAEQFYVALAVLFLTSFVFLCKFILWISMSLNYVQNNIYFMQLLAKILKPLKKKTIVFRQLFSSFKLLIIVACLYENQN